MISGEVRIDPGSHSIRVLYPTVYRSVESFRNWFLLPMQDYGLGGHYEIWVGEKSTKVKEKRRGNKIITTHRGREVEKM